MRLNTWVTLPWSQVLTVAENWSVSTAKTS